MSTSQVIVHRFEIRDLKKDLLGRGGMGDVYRATDTQTGQMVAIKALQPEVVANAPDIVARFMREGEALRQLKHSNIVGMVAAVEEEVPTTGAVVHYLVMEYVAGGSLWDLLDEQKTLPHVRAVEISLELADALARAHHLGVIHRDLKPADVLLAQIGGRQRLLMLGAHPLLLSENGASAASDELAVLAIDLDGASLARIFTAGSREFVPGPASALVIDDDRILVSFDDRLVMLDVGLALEAVFEATSSQ